MAEAIYGMNYSNFIGVDRSSDPRVVARNRLAYSVNMWRDYESEQGAAIETFPGFRRVAALKEDENDIHIISGMHHYKGKKHEYILIHKYDELYVYNVTSGKMESEPIYTGLNPNGATAIAINNRLYLISNANGTAYNAKMVVVSENENGEIKAEEVSKYYTPTTYYNGQPYEQRNAFTNRVTQIDTGAGIEDNIKQDSNGESIKVRKYILYEKASAPISVFVNNVGYENAASNQLDYKKYATVSSGGYIKYIILREQDVMDADTGNFYEVELNYNADPVHFNTVGNLAPFKNDKITMADAILGCTKSAVYDGRVFLTGNPELPNTVFYSQRNLTGANDPTYFGVYNYFNDGDGNTPNVDLLATPSMLMVIKGDTVQDGSIYYHVGTDNPHSEKSVRDLVPRIYPSSTGAAGLGSAGLTDAYSLSCNFLDDPVFISKRGLEGVTKEQLNAERTVQHRSSTIDRLLIQEDLAHASLAEWKGYLVVCCNGHIYLADSRTRTQNAYGSYQYEWFYLEGVGTYEGYYKVFSYITEYPYIDVPYGLDDNGNPNQWIQVSLAEFEIIDGEFKGKTVGEVFNKSLVDKKTDKDAIIFRQTVYHSGITNTAIEILYDYTTKEIVNILPEKMGIGEFYGAKRVLAVGELLFFATDYDICVFNTDKRGVPIKDDNGNIIRDVDSDKIDSSWYSFNGVPYISGCSIRLDDCDKKTVTKANVYGTIVARFKMIPGSKCTVKSSINGVNWKKIGEAFISRLNFEDFRFDNVAFTENEDGVFVFPEVSRGWVSKQYYFYSDGFCEPFGLYELSYNYKIVGKIRR